jgi:hypothetical protein
MRTKVVKLKAFGKYLINRVSKKVVIVLMAGVLAVGLLAYSKRHTIIVWHLQANKKAQEITINEVIENAKPRIARELNMDFSEKVLSQVTLNRSEKARRIDALADVRTFVELSFKNHWLRFKDVHKLSSINGFPLDGCEFALGWNRGNKEEVLAAFNISLLKGKADKMRINDNCSFYTELREYVGTKAKKNQFPQPPPLPFSLPFSLPLIQ